MSKLHYFQRYAGKENWITNATLLLLSRFYHYDRLKFETFINEIFVESNQALKIGVDFSQQQWGENSVVDGVISQESFKIVIETKLNDKFSTDQLRRHLDAFNGNYSQKILLALSKNKADNNLKIDIIGKLQEERYKDIKFASATYEGIYEGITSKLSDYDLEMKEIVDDYLALCIEHGLTNIQNRTMLAFTAGESLKENIKYNIYYDPISRNHNSPFRYIGLYVNKVIVAVGKLEKIVCCDYEDGKLIATNGCDFENLTEGEYRRIKEIIENTDYYDLSQGSRFFLVDNFNETRFVKTSFSSVRGKRYFWLDQIEKFIEGMSAKEVANLLNGQSFK